jgi:hypothetical protein
MPCPITAIDRDIEVPLYTDTGSVELIGTERDEIDETVHP